MTDFIVDDGARGLFVGMITADAATPIRDRDMRVKGGCGQAAGSRAALARGRRASAGHEHLKDIAHGDQ